MTSRNRTAELLDIIPQLPSSSNHLYLSRQLDRLQENIEIIRHLHKERLAAVGSANLRELQRDLDDLDQHSRDIISTCHNELQNLIYNGEGVGSLGSRLRMLTLQLSKVQGAAGEEYRQRTAREIRIALPEASESQVRDLVDDYEPGMAFAKTLAGNRRVLRDVLTRKDEMRKLERSVEELAEMFTQIHELLTMQQEKIDIVENQVDAVNEDLEFGGKEMKKAIDTRISTRKRLMWLTIILVVLCLCVGLYLAFHFYCHDSFNFSQDCKI